MEVLREDYVRTSWAKRLEGRIVVYKHALNNALIPVVTIVGGQLRVLLAGTVVVETIFALPGMGRLTVEAILFRDYPVAQTNVMLVAGTLVALNLMVEQAPWLVLSPGLAISLAVLGFNLFGDTLRDAWDPKLRRS